MSPSVVDLMAYMNQALAGLSLQIQQQASATQQQGVAFSALMADRPPLVRPTGSSTPVFGLSSVDQLLSPDAAAAGAGLGRDLQGGGGGEPNVAGLVGAKPPRRLVGRLPKRSADVPATGPVSKARPVAGRSASPCPVESVTGTICPTSPTVV